MVEAEPVEAQPVETPQKPLDEVVPDVAIAVDPEVVVPLPEAGAGQERANREKEGREARAQGGEEKGRDARAQEGEGEKDVEAGRLRIGCEICADRSRREVEAAGELGQLEGQGRVMAEAAPALPGRREVAARARAMSRSPSASTPAGGSSRPASRARRAMPSSIAPRWIWCGGRHRCRRRRTARRRAASSCRWRST